jgi:RNA polymerase sigma-70 factor (ECF subfamily)
MGRTAASQRFGRDGGIPGQGKTPPPRDGRLPTAGSDALALTPLDLGESPAPPDRPTAELVRLAREGDHDAFATLVERHEQMVLRTARRLLDRLDQAQDAAQETFLRLFRYLGRYDETREMGPWLYRVVVNVCRDLGRRSGERRLVALDEAHEGRRTASPDDPGGTFEAVARDEQHRLVQAALLTLPERERAALVLRDLEGRPSPPGDAQRVFVIQHVSADLLARLLKVFPAEIRSVYGRGLNALAVSAKPAVLAAIAETIKRLDQPDAGVGSTRSSVELTGYILEGLDERQESEALPSDLQAVVGQLRRTFKYGGYRLLDTIVARTRADGSRFSVSGVTEKKLNALGPSYYHLDANRTAVVGEAPRVVQLTNLNFGLEIPVPVGPPPSDDSKPREFQYKRIGLSSDMDIRDGQYVVVGKSGLGDSDDALVLVLTAKVVD